jgi:hypothetical protein
MLYTYQYTTAAERQTIIDSHTDKFLTEERNITEGNFLVFSDIKPLENSIQDIKNNTDMILLKQEGIIA